MAFDWNRPYCPEGRECDELVVRQEWGSVGGYYTVWRRPDKSEYVVSSYLSGNPEYGHPRLVNRHEPFTFERPVRVKATGAVVLVGPELHSKVRMGAWFDRSALCSTYFRVDGKSVDGQVQLENYEP